MSRPVFEILTWKSSLNVSDETMISTMSRFSEVVKQLSGFLYQSLYKNADNKWVCIYFWETEADAHASNKAVANTPELSELMCLIEENSISMEVLSSLQNNGVIRFT